MLTLAVSPPPCRPSGSGDWTQEISPKRDPSARVCFRFCFCFGFQKYRIVRSFECLAKCEGQEKNRARSACIWENTLVKRRCCGWEHRWQRWREGVGPGHHVFSTPPHLFPIPSPEASQPVVWWGGEAHRTFSGGPPVQRVVGDTPHTCPRQGWAQFLPRWQASWDRGVLDVTQGRWQRKGRRCT